MLAPTPTLPPRLPLDAPTPRERQLTWGTIFVSLVVFWYLVGVGLNALWSSYVG